MKTLIPAMLITPILAIACLFYLQNRLIDILHEQIYHSTFEVLNMLSRHRVTDTPVSKYADWKDASINHGLNRDRRGFEISRSTDIYLIEQDAGKNCYWRSQPRFSGFYDHYHMFVKCSRAVDRTLHAGGFRGFSENYFREPVLSVGRLIKARAFDNKFTELVLLAEINEAEVLELVKPQEQAIKALSYVLSAIILASTLLSTVFLYFTDRKRAKAERERDKALADLRLAIDVSTDDDY